MGMGTRESISGTNDQVDTPTFTETSKQLKRKYTESAAGRMYESDFETEIESIEDGILKDGKETFLFHPEGSFLASLHDKSEENVAALIKNSTSTLMEKSKETELIQLENLLPEIREHIWQYLSYIDRLQVRLTCRNFRDEIDNTVGIQLYLSDADEDSLRLALTTSAIQRLIIRQVDMSALGTFVPTNPSRLLDLEVQGPVSPDVLHEILRRCPNIQSLEICHQPQEHSLLNSYGNPTWGSLDNWHLGKLFLESEIKQYGFLKKLRHFRFISKNAAAAPEVIENLVTYSLLPLLRSLQSYNLRSIDVEICLWEEASKKIMPVLFEIILRSRSLQQFRFHELRTDSNAFQPIRQVDQDGGGRNSIALGFGDFNPCPQFESIHIQIPFSFTSYFHWINLLQSQKKLKHLIWDVGGNYFGYPVQAIRHSGKTLESLTLRILRCYRHENMEPEEKPEFFSMEAIYEFIALKQLQIVGMELSTCRFSRLDLLPRTLQCLQIESFHILPDQLTTIHQTLPNLRLLSLSHWNDSRLNFMQSLSVILDMISSSVRSSKDRKYRGLSFIEKSMYTSMEELAEINALLGRIRQVAFVNKLSVDQVSGDNGMGFILVIGEQQESFEDVTKM